jgi:ketosteroid isomerase-like protein
VNVGEVGPARALSEDRDSPNGELPAVEVARRYVAAYNAGDLEAMLAVMDPDVSSVPSQLFGRYPHRGHAGVRKWWQKMAASPTRYDVVVRELRPVDQDRVAVLGDLYLEGERMSPWGVIVRIRNGLIVESRSYLSDRDLLDALGVIGG